MTYSEIQTQLLQLFTKLGDLDVLLAKQRNNLLDIDSKLLLLEQEWRESSEAFEHVCKGDVISIELYVYTSNRKEAAEQCVTNQKLEKTKAKAAVEGLTAMKNSVKEDYQKLEALLAKSLDNIVYL